MNASLQYPFDLHWTSHDLVDAIPLRLSEMLDFDAHRDGEGSASANAASIEARRRTAGFLPRPQAALFRVC